MSSGLHCDPMVSDLVGRAGGKVGPFELLACQVKLTDSLERQWYDLYLEFLSMEEKAEAKPQDQESKKPACREHTVRRLSPPPVCLPAATYTWLSLSLSLWLEIPLADVCSKCDELSPGPHAPSDSSPLPQLLEG